MTTIAAKTKSGKHEFQIGRVKGDFWVPTIEGDTFFWKNETTLQCYLSQSPNIVRKYGVTGPSLTIEFSKETAKNIRGFVNPGSVKVEMISEVWRSQQSEIETDELVQTWKMADGSLKEFVIKNHKI